MLNPPDQMTKLIQIDQNGVQIQWWIHLNISSLQTVIPYTSGAQSTTRSPILSSWCFISFRNSMTHNAVVTAQRKYCCLDITRRSQNLKPLEVHSLTPKSYLWHVLMHCPHKLCKSNGISCLHSEFFKSKFQSLIFHISKQFCDATTWPTASHGSHPTWYAAKLPSISI